MTTNAQLIVSGGEVVFTMNDVCVDSYMYICYIIVFSVMCRFNECIDCFPVKMFS